MSQAQNLPRWFLGLAGVTLIALLATVYVLVQQRQVSAPPFAARLLFPGLEERLTEVSALSIKTNEEDFSLTLTDKGWVLPGKDNYPVNLMRLSDTLVGLAALELVDAKTKNPARHKALGLGDPTQEGNGTALTLSDPQGAPLATIILGRPPAISGGHSGAKRLYVRLPQNDQTWIAQGTLGIYAQEADWLDRDLFGITNDDIAAADIRPGKTGAYRLVRADATNNNFTLEADAKGRTPKAPFTWNPTALALAGLPISDVKRLEENNKPETSTQIDVTLFDGVHLSLRLWQDDNSFWLDLTDAKAGDNEEANTRAAALKARTAQWAFAIPQYKYEQFTKALKDLLEPTETAKTP